MQFDAENKFDLTMMVSSNVMYLAVFLSAAISAKLPDESAVEPVYESANVCTSIALYR